MSILSKVFLAAACAVVAVNAQTANYASFCERWTQALNPTDPNSANNGTLQRGTIMAVVNKAVLGSGGVNGNAGTFPFPVVGIVNQATLAGFFNGTWPPMHDYVTNYATNPLFTELATQLYNYFQVGLHCRAAATMWPFVATGTLVSLHSAMMITDAQEALFGTEVGYAAAWNGVAVGDPTVSTSEAAYVGAVFKQFGRGGGDNQICSEVGAGKCAYAPLQEIWTQTSPPAFVVNGVVNGNVSIMAGGNVHWNIGSVHNVRQVDDAVSTTPTTNGFGTGAGAIGGNGGTLTVNFPTAGMYYYICQPHVGAAIPMRGQIWVTAAPPAGESSTGVPSSASTVAVSAFAVVAVALAAAKLL